MDQATSLDIEALKVIRRHALPPRGRETHQAASVGGRGDLWKLWWLTGPAVWMRVLPSGLRVKMSGAGVGRM